ncbi:MAG: DUF58 domain-containing protein [Bacteroidia bacterium]|nr:DUF58 domain-containing protein [Bacteroidia bacterium]MBP9689371.1 DUF58 domain-containing protein [Bacteroidia bacterium]
MQTLTPETLLNTNNLELLATQVVEGFITGLHKSPFHGFSVEFAEHRIYNTGESTRHIDWKLFGRTDKLFIKRYEEETNLRCQIVIDTSSSMFYPTEGLNKIRFSVFAAASLMQLLSKQRDASGLSLINKELVYHSQCKVSQTHVRMLYAKMEELLKPQADNTVSNLANSLHQLAERLHRRSLVLIFSDMFTNPTENDALFSALQHLKYNKHEVVLFHVLDDATEHKFNFTNRPYLFVDSETGEKMKLFPAQVKEQYLQALTAHQKQLKLKCAQFKIEFVEANVGNDFSQVLLPFLVKRNKMK